MAIRAPTEESPIAADVGALEQGLQVDRAEGATRQKSITIGAVCKALAQEFPDISISKIRYLEDQKLVTPRRTPGGYRLYTQSDVARLRMILRLQRDEFLPLRVIRQELASGRGDGGATPPPGRENVRSRRAGVSVREDSGALFSLEEVLEETKADAKLVRELEEYGVVKGELRGGTRYYDETEREIVGAVAELARYGVGGRNLRVFRSSADREANLLQQILAPALRSRNPQRRKEALEALENLAAVTTHLRHLLLVRDLRKIAGLMQAPGRGAAGGETGARAAPSMADLRALIRDIPDFPRPGVMFKDITPLLADPAALAHAVRGLADWARPLGVDCVVAAEARGFLLGPALALELGAGFVLARKPGKLPYETISAEYLLEYGSGELELHSDAIHRGTRVLVHDDLLATGGTARALCELVAQLGGEVVGCGFLIELAFLGGRERLAPHDAHALIAYAS